MKQMTSLMPGAALVLCLIGPTVFGGDVASAVAATPSADADADADADLDLDTTPDIPREIILRADGSIFKFAKPRAMKAPRYPRRMADMGAEGWVMLSYVVKKDGTVRDPIVVDSSRREFERYAIQAVRDFIYTPAEVDGQPIEQGTHFRISFALEPRSDAARPDFVRRFKQIERQIERGELEKATVALASMESIGRLNLYEDAFYWWARAMYHNATNEHRQRRDSLRRAIAYAGEDQPSGLPAELHLRALALLYGEHIRTGELAAALDVYRQLVARAGQAKVSADMRAHAESVRALLEGDDTLQAQGYIVDDRTWFHTLSRDGFEFADVIGRLDRFSLWCEQRAVELEIHPDSSWQVPPSWGACQIYVSGAPGTSFTVLEYSTATVE
jgi:TonB family protein